MTVKELIEKLQQFEDKDLEVSITNVDTGQVSRTIDQLVVEHNLDRQQTFITLDVSA